ncbi:3-oxoacyl-[acyl-carrier-protein] reductase [Anderseniella sp. Alg231-50]|uniref:3-oxoacyl-[acyl-carrier-protein] reductase n=1 Tax=Anderseniella sp. Alg231-50 TaxID=1922226 RepID=UPI000D562A14
MFDLTGKKALITGATGGIGAAIAKALHANGATVALSGTRAAVLEEVKAGLAERAHALTCNLSDPDDVEKLVPAAQEAMDGLDILVNNAGITRDNLAMRMKREDWQAVMDVNLTAAFTLTKNCMRTMMKQRWGRVINITSVVGVTGNAGQANYAASKAGMIGMSKSLAQELASRNITVNCIAPGFIETAMTDELNDKQKEAILASVPAGRLGHTDEIAAGAAYLASEEAAYVTGQTLHINGGMAML